MVCVQGPEPGLDLMVAGLQIFAVDRSARFPALKAQADKFSYQDADEMVSFCSLHQIPMRGHCIFWEDESNCQDWLKFLPPGELKDALHSRAADLLTRYKGKFLHYDVNNEILHGKFYRERPNAEILPYMFKLARQFDPEAALFVNDFHVEDGVDGDSSPDKYVQLVEWLVNEGAPVGGVGVQGHAEAPVESILRRCLEKLSGDSGKAPCRGTTRIWWRSTTASTQPGSVSCRCVRSGQPRHMDELMSVATSPSGATTAATRPSWRAVTKPSLWISRFPKGTVL